jgi:type II secretory pathway component PulF
MNKFISRIKSIRMPPVSAFLNRPKSEHATHQASHKAPTHPSQKKHSSKAKKPLLLHFSTQEQAMFAKRLAMILRSGMPIMQGLHMMGTQAQTASSSYIYKSLIAHVDSGQPLSSAMQKFSSIFGDFCINIVKVGESSGTLHENLDYLAEELKKKKALSQKVLGALVYPAVIVLATIGISLVLTVYIFPKITPIFQSFKSELPLPTRILITLSNLLMSSGGWILLGLVITAIFYFFLLRVRFFHLFVDRILLKLPLFGRLSQYYHEPPVEG